MYYSILTYFISVHLIAVAAPKSLRAWPVFVVASVNACFDLFTLQEKT